MYKPQPRIAEIMNWSLERIKNVPYEVTLRWIFYQAYQASKSKIVPWVLEGGKSEYKNFIHWTSRVRKEFWNGWTPHTLVDDGRKMQMYGGGYSTPQEWFESFKLETCLLDKRITQEEIILVCFEADAMRRQFEYETDIYHVPLIPFRGDASIEYKWRIAKQIENMSNAYNKAVRVLYFGDLDPKGEEIPENALRDIRKWCNIDFEYNHIGLKQEHIERWNLPENPEKHGYQWEALDDSMAHELICNALDKYVDLDEIMKVLKRETEATDIWHRAIEEIVIK